MPAPWWTPGGTQCVLFSPCSNTELDVVATLAERGTEGFKCATSSDPRGHRPHEPLSVPLPAPAAQGSRSPPSVQIHRNSNWRHIFIFMQMRLSRVFGASKIL